MVTKASKTNLLYLFAVTGLLLVMCIITVPRLDWDGLWYDEVFSVMNAGGAHYGPLSPVGIWQQVIEEDPYQSLGYPNMLALWGLLVGWTEFATRLSSLLFAMLTVALTYRLGRAVANPTIGFFAAMIVSVSTFMIYYAHELRAFTLVSLFAAFLLWSYAQLLREKSMTNRRLQTCFVIAGTGILYTHYFGAMLLIGIGFHHLLFVKKDKQWWQVVSLGVVISLVFVPQLVAFWEGLSRYNAEDVAGSALSAVGIMTSILHYISNGLPVVAVLALLLGTWVAVKLPALRMIISVTVFGVIVTLILNQILQIMEPTRLRYTIFLWPGLAIWLGAGLYHPFIWLMQRITHPRLAFAIAAILPMVWFMNAVYMNYRPNFTDSLTANYIPRLRTINNILQAEGAPDDLLALYNGVSQQAWYIRDSLDYAMSGIPMPTMITSALFDTEFENRDWARDQIAAAERVWYAMNRTIPINDNHTNFVLYLQSDFTLCDTYLDTDDLFLQLYTREASFCPDSSSIVSFGDDFNLTGYDAVIQDDMLSLSMGWDLADDVPPEIYSLAIHVTEYNTPDVIAAQADIGFEDETFAAMSVDIDLSDLEAGLYQVWVTVYEWETGERLTGQSNRTSLTGERLPVDAFYISEITN